MYMYMHVYMYMYMYIYYILHKCMHAADDDDFLTPPLKIDITRNFVMELAILDAGFGFLVKKYAYWYPQCIFWTNINICCI